MIAMLVKLQGFISLPSFIFVSAVVSDIHESIKKKTENVLTPFLENVLTPFHIIDMYFNQSYFSHTTLW